MTKVRKTKKKPPLLVEAMFSISIIIPKKNKGMTLKPNSKSPY